MRPVQEWDESDLISLIRDEVPESLALDYKRSAALAKNDKEKNELSKDVSAFANSEGGLLIYGMQEGGHIPTAVDVGLNRSAVTKECLESVVKSKIHPVVDRLLIKQVPLPSKGAELVAYVLQIEQATSRAPHQAFDHRYYKRFNFESTPMEDYEVRDLMRRSIEYGKKYGAAWELDVEIQRLRSAINERSRMETSHYVPRDRLIVRVSNALRSAGGAVVLLEKPLRSKVADLINRVDQFNSEIETVDPGRRDEARLTIPLKTNLAAAVAVCMEVSSALRTILEREP
jgi:hypothetical protein